MSNFEINMFSRTQEFYRFNTEDFALLELGLGSYTITSLANFLGLDPVSGARTKPVNPDIAEFFGGNADAGLLNQLIGVTSQGSMGILDFDLVTKVYSPITGFAQIVRLDQDKYKPNKFTQPAPDIKSFLLKWNDIQKGLESNEAIVNGYKAVAYRIQNSASGCITFTTKLSILGGYDYDTNIQLYILDKMDSESSRTMAINGSPLMSVVPRLPYGPEYGFRSTNDGNTGEYRSQVGGGKNNPENTAAAQLRTAYDPSTGEVESGTQQMLARLLTDIDPANVPDLTADQLEAMTRSDNYDSGVDSELWLGGHTKGKAIPLSAENGNPYLFGPDYKDGCEGTNKNKITVINRLNEAYKAGSVVVVSRMLGESGNWVIVSPGQPVAAKRKLSFGNFEFQQYIIPADHYFAVPGSAEQYLPDKWISKFRDDYYLNIKNNGYAGSFLQDAHYLNEIIELNIVASALGESEEDPIATLHELIKPGGGTQVTLARNNSKIFGKRTSDYLVEYLSNIYSPIPPQGVDSWEDNIWFPKNITKRSASLVSDYASSSKWYPPDPVGALEVPIFWGMLFPDGYKSAQVSKFKTFLSTYPFAKDDPNLSECPIIGSICFPDLQNSLESLLFAENILSANQSNILSFKRQTGGVLTHFNNVQPNAFNFQNLYDRVSMNHHTGPQFAYSINSIDPHGLEPLNPARLQFSSLSIEAMYMNSILKALDFKNINENIDYIKDISYNGFTFADYALSLIQSNKDDGYAGDYISELGNIYTIKQLSIADAFNISNTSAISPTLTRHPAPIGTLFGFGVSIAPRVGEKNRLPSMPILTCKSTIRTTADSIRFTINESIGVMEKKTATPGSAGDIAIIPLFPPIILPIGGSVQPSINSYPQWGGGDEIDSFGTTALHVRIYESVPPNQIIYLGPMFAPLHFNPSSPTFIHTINYDENGIGTLNKTEQFSVSPVDFRMPTYKNGIYISPGTQVLLEDKDDIAPASDWKLNTVRRGKLLSGGGFAYYKRMFAIKDVKNAPTNGGSGYSEGDKFVYSDGSELEVTETKDGGEIVKVTFTNNIEGFYLKKDNSTINAYTTVSNVSPIYMGEGGSGASFEIISFMCVNKLGYDRAPRSSSIVRLTSPNNRGESGAINGVRETSVLLPESDKLRKEYDIFYYYHNDPSHYSMYEEMAFNQGFAQYAISEIQPD